MAQEGAGSERTDGGEGGGGEAATTTKEGGGEAAATTENQPTEERRWRLNPARRRGGRRVNKKMAWRTATPWP